MERKCRSVVVPFSVFHFFLSSVLRIGSTDFSPRLFDV